MRIEEFIVEWAWRVREFLPASWPLLTEDQALASLVLAEREASRYQLPEFAQSLVRQCAYTDPSGLRCLTTAVTPPIYGFLCRNPDAPMWGARIGTHGWIRDMTRNSPAMYRDVCWPFMGALCVEHVDHLVVPMEDWWPSEENVLEVALA